MNDFLKMRQLVGRRAIAAVAVLFGATALPPAEIAAGQGPAAIGSRLERIIDEHPVSRRTTVALKVVDLASGETLVDRGGDRLFVPASNLKIYTSACALDLLGPERRFKTTLRARGELRDGVLSGDLVLEGGGDAMFSHEQLGELALNAVKAWDLREVRGAVIVDNSRYAPRLKGPGWMWDDEPDYYNMSVTPLMVDFNVLTVRIEPERNGGPHVELAPPSDYPPVKAMTSDSLKEPTITRDPFTDAVRVALPEDLTRQCEERLTMHDPGPWVAGMFRAMLESEGVQFVRREPGRGDDSGDAALPVAAELTFAGPPLIDAIDHFHEKSENAVGEVLLHEIAIHNGVARPDWSDGAAAVTDWLQNVAGLEASSFRLVDGSGLSRYNLVSADSAVKLLAFMNRHKCGKEFFDSLPRYELDAATEADAGVMIAAKPGGMQSVSTISGYLRTRSGRLLAFSLLANGYVGSNKPVFDLRQKIWRALAEDVADSAAASSAGK